VPMGGRGLHSAEGRRQTRASVNLHGVRRIWSLAPVVLGVRVASRHATTVGWQLRGASARDGRPLAIVTRTSAARATQAHIALVRPARSRRRSLPQSMPALLPQTPTSCRRFQFLHKHLARRTRAQPILGCCVGSRKRSKSLGSIPAWGATCIAMPLRNSLPFLGAA
jgi:hypothetical protein